MKHARTSVALALLWVLCLADPIRAAPAYEGGPASDPAPGEMLRVQCQAAAEQGDLPGAVELCKGALEAFRLEGNAQGEGDALLALGWLAELLQQHEDALAYYEAALALLREEGDPALRAQAQGGLCRILYPLGDHARASDACAESSTLFHELGDAQGEATALYVLGLALQSRAAQSGSAELRLEARAAYAGAQALYESVGNRAGEAGTLVGLGDLGTLAGDHQAALDFYLRALPIHQELGSESLAMVTLGSIAAAYASLSDSQNALRYYEQALPLRRKAGDLSGEAATLSGMGLAHKRLGDYPSALARYGEALTLWQDLGNRPWEALVAGAIGDIYSVQFDYPRAESSYENALSVYRELQDRPGEALTLQALAGTYFDSADYAPALELYRQALSIRRDLGDRLGESRTLNNMALVYDALSQYEQALSLYQDALEIKEEIGDAAGQAAVLGNIAAIYAVLYEGRRAQDTYTAALEAARTAGDQPGVMASLSGLGTVLRQQGRYDEALDSHQQALLVARQIGDRKGESAALGNLAVVYDELGQDARALELHHQALAIRQQMGDIVGEATTRTLLGELLLESADLAGAETYLAAALETWRSTGDLRSEATTLGDLALLYEQQGQPDRATETALQAIEVLESIYTTIKTEDLQSLFAGGVNGYYRYTVHLLLAQGREQEAFELAERGRARAFLNLLGNRPVNAKESEDSALVLREAALRAEMGAVERTLQGAPQPDDERASLPAGDAAGRLALLREEYEQLLPDLQLSNSEYASMVGVDPMTLPQVQALLREQAPDVTLLSYFVGAQETVIFVVSGDGFHTLQVPVAAEDLERQVEALLAQMRISPLLPDAWQPPARLLYAELVAPVEPFLPPSRRGQGPRLGIIPFGRLHYLPFGLLHAAGGDLRLLQDRYTLFYAPSASSLRFLLARRPAAGDGLLVMANADAPGAPHLAHAAGEARTVAALFGTAPLLGEQATESRFVAESGAARILHLAAHSELQPANPFFSAILLRPDGASDGRLETHEILNLRLPATDLVVLSACQTHLGKLSEGDELVGLERAFFRAGAPSLVTTLWPVDDKATALLVEGFYTRLRAGMPKAEALRQAQQEVRKTYPHPYYWAGFVLVGAPGTALPQAGPFPWGWLAAGAALLALAALLAFFYLRRRRTRTDPTRPSPR